MPFFTVRTELCKIKAVPAGAAFFILIIFCCYHGDFMLLKKWFNRRRAERRHYLLDAIDNQLEDNDPAGIKEVYEQMISRGYSPLEVKEMFAAVFEGELHRLNNLKVKEFDREGYLKSLKAIK